MMEWREECYCKRCDLDFISNTPDAICPKCGMYDQLFDSKENTK